ADGIIERRDGAMTTFCTAEDWTGERGEKPLILHAAAMAIAETETLWLSPQPPPLPSVGWAMPASVPDPAPSPFLLRPGRARRPGWLRFPLPVGVSEMEQRAPGAVRVWIDGNECAVKEGRAPFPAQRAGAVAAVRVQPDGFA